MNKLLTGRRSVITTALCAVFAFLGWLASLNGPSLLSISLYVLAFVVGGSQKAVEGLSSLAGGALNVDRNYSAGPVRTGMKGLPTRAS